MNDALMQVKKDLGSDAIILNSKQIKDKGVFGLFKKNRIEVIAALDPHPIQKKKQSTQQVETRQFKSPVVPKMTNDLDQQQVLQEIKQLRQLVASKTFQGNNPFTAPFDVLFQFLLEQGVSNEVAENMVLTIQGDVESTESEEQMLFSFEQFLKGKFEANLHNPSPSHKQVIQFVGPTGVGKTTTIAKVAAKTMLEEKKRVAFITTDTYRIAAIEQLKTYARILDVPLEVVYSREDYEKALDKFADYDHIFVDTAGRNYRELNYVQELKHLIQMADGNSITYLVLSLTAKGTDNAEIYHIFKNVGIHQLIFTKADETTTYGMLINLCFGQQAGVAYVSNGQNVPDDLVQVDANYLTELILSRYRHV